MKGERIIWLDIARAFAILSVILCHTAEQLFTSPKDFDNLFRICIHNIGRLGVPMFLFISGYLLLSKQINTDKDCFKFYKRNLLKLFIAIELWNLIYNIFMHLYTKAPINYVNLLHQLLFIEKSPLPHMWYMSLILGMYIVIPFLAVVVKRFSIKSLFFPMLFTCVVVMLLPNINLLLQTYKVEVIKSIIIDTSFLGGVYGLYLISGYLLGNGILRKIPTYLALTFGIACFTFTCWFQYHINKNGFKYDVWYDFIGIFLASIFFFEIMHRMDHIGNNILIKKATEELSINSLGMFFIHYPLQMIMFNIHLFSFISSSGRIIVMFMISAAISYLLVKLLSQINILKKWLFLIKA